MRTTLTIDDDVLDKARDLAAKKRVPFRRVINEALRAGLVKVKEPASKRPYRTRPHSMGLKPGLSLDNVQDLLTRAEGEDRR